MGNLCVTNTFSDFDEFSDMIHAWDLDFRQLDSGEFHASMLQFSSSTSLLSHVKFNRSLDQRGASPQGKWTFALFSDYSTAIVWHEQEISKNTIVVYKPGAEIDCVSRPGFEVFTLSFTEEHLNTICNCLGLPNVFDLLQGSNQFACSYDNLSEIRLKLQWMVNTVRHHAIKDNQATLSSCLENEFPEMILSIFSKSNPLQFSRPTLRMLAIQKIKGYLETCPRKPVTVGKLCKIAGVSERTLQYAFQDQFGVSPKTYLNIFRLNGFRKKLLNSDCNTTRINDVASLWEFWHIGQLASDYRKLFGELPSETLRQKKS